MQRQFPILNEHAGPVPAEVISDCLNGAFNDEVRGLLTILFYSNHLVPHGASSLAETLTTLQGKKPIAPPEPQTITDYCRTDLRQTANVIVPADWSEKTGGEVAWVASPDYYMGKLGLAGFMTNFGLLYPDVFLSKIYGQQGDTPELRHRICEAIVFSKSTLSIAGVATLLEEPRNRIRHHVDHLARMGVIKRPSDHDDDPEILVKDNRTTPRPAYRTYKPETQALYDALQNIDNGTTLRLGELLDRAVEVNSDIDSALLRADIRMGISGGSIFPGLEAVVKRQKGVTISPEVIEPFTVLCEGVRKIREGVGLKENAELAVNLLDKPARIRTLIKKSNESSVGYMSADQSKQKILDILRTHGACRFSDIHEALGERVQSRTIRKVVSALIAENAISATPVKDGSHTKKVSNIYTLLPEKHS